MNSGRVETARALAATQRPSFHYRFSIADFRLLMDIGRSCHRTFSIVDRQSTIGNENLVFGCGRRRPCPTRWEEHGSGQGLNRINMNATSYEKRHCAPPAAVQRAAGHLRSMPLCGRCCCEKGVTFFRYPVKISFPDSAETPEKQVGAGGAEMNHGF